MYVAGGRGAAGIRLLGTTRPEVVATACRLIEVRSDRVHAANVYLDVEEKFSEVTLGKRIRGPIVEPGRCFD